MTYKLKSFSEEDVVTLKNPNKGTGSCRGCVAGTSIPKLASLFEATF